MRSRTRSSLCATACLLVLFAAPSARAQEALSAMNSLSGGVGYGASGLGSFGANAFGVGSAALLAAGRTNSTSLSLSAGMGETDNVRFNSNVKQSQTLATAGLDVALSRHKPRLDAAVIGDFQDFYYVQGAFGNNFTGRLDGNANVGLIPNRLDWVIDEDFGQSQINPVVPTVPTNLQNVNVVTTGPDLLFHPGGMRNFLQLGVRYGRSDYGTSQFDGTDEIGLFALGHRPSQASALAVHVTYQKMRFDNTIINRGYTLRKAYGSYEVQGARTRVALYAGAAQVNDIPLRSSEWKTRPIGKVILSRQISPTMTLVLQGERQVTDAADSFSGLQSGAASAIRVAPVYGTTASYVSTGGSAGWTFALNRTSIGASASWEQSAYDLSSALDTRMGEYELRFGRQLTPYLTLQLAGIYSKTDYYHSNFQNDRRSANLALQWALGRKLHATLQYQYTSQGTTGVASELTRSGYFNLVSLSRVYVTDAYSANSVFLTLTYVPISQ